MFFNNCKLSALPDDWGQLVELEKLYLSHNRLQRFTIYTQIVFLFLQYIQAIISLQSAVFDIIESGYLTRWANCLVSTSSTQLVIK
jgi:hypothetical protein